jgi:hypothetical protein
MAVICGDGQALAVRVIEYIVTVAGADAPELFCLVTDLEDHEAYPARATARAATDMAVPARKGRRARHAVHPREISFAAAHAIIASARGRPPPACPRR